MSTTTGFLTSFKMYAKTVTVVCFLFGHAAAVDDWIGEVVELANKRCDLPPNPNLAALSPSYYEPKNLSEAQKIEMLLKGLSSEKTPKRRLSCLKILVERFPLTTAQKIESIATNGSLDIAIRKRAIWVAGFMRDEKSIVWLEELLESMEPSIREASMDALGFCMFPFYLKKFVENHFSDPLGVSISGDIPIYVGNAFRFGTMKQDVFSGMDNLKAARKLANNRVGKQLLRKRGDEATRTRIAGRLTKIMLKGRTQRERIAAARALVGCEPKGYKLRVAEWGVWIASEGKLQLAKTVLDEIPPIAYQTTKQISELKKRVNQIMIVTKPIVHLRVDRPLSVNVTAFIRRGQPWFTYPQPNSFDVKVDGNVRGRDYTDAEFQKSKNLTSENSAKWKGFGEQAHQGYPFLLPKASMVGGYGGRFGNSNIVQAIGVTWQHLIVTPKQMDWMSEPIVARDYRWWTDLRKVDSSWISNGFETEKFLYYDGPTLLPSPVRIEYSGKGKDRELMVRYFGVLVNPKAGKVSTEELNKPIALLVEVKDGKIRGRQLDFDYATNERKRIDEVKKKLNVGDLTMLYAKHSENKTYELKGKAIVKQALLAMLKEKDGLTVDEAQGLIGAWEKQFFQTEGKRLIVRMRRQDYDFQCPLKVDPKPTQISRVGLVLSELEE